MTIVTTLTGTPATGLASVALPSRRTELREFALPPATADTGWVRVEASGICGTDVTLYNSGVPQECVLGHHAVGEIADLGEAAAQRWGVRPGDHVVLEEYLPCGHCAQCRAGRYRLCPDTDLWSGGRRLGTVGVAEAPSLWGGNAQYLHLAPNSVVHRLPPGLPTALAVWALPLANALDWTLGAGALAPGEDVVVLGPGYHGLAAVAAACHGGAATVLASGLPSDQARLRIAAGLGAATAESGGEAAALALLTGDGLADVVLDLAGGEAASVERGLALLRPGGRLVIGGIKSPGGFGLDAAELVRRVLTVRAVRGRAPERVTQAIGVLAAGGAGLGAVPTVQVGLDGVGAMLERLAAGRGPGPPHVVVRPWEDGEGDW
ncbi:zinc-dependent alcohol dehydrogenase [Pseudonocardia sp. H11422]|uniref:zinc-dependent alcohol dehydrogenase n=1 Tax=Pseudonocardia sp. H11422 TaxID=2835866 RepID=UPI001BDD8572|nr:alcohol dehydrogenase catalytic domain-containing protein [Pseudonocardia sp. H11422]